MRLDKFLNDCGIGTRKQIKEYVKNAILDGRIENNFEQAFELMKSKGSEMGLTNKA